METASIILLISNIKVMDYGKREESIQCVEKAQVDISNLTGIDLNERDELHHQLNLMIDSINFNEKVKAEIGIRDTDLKNKDQNE